RGGGGADGLVLLLIEHGADDRLLPELLDKGGRLIPDLLLAEEAADPVLDLGEGSGAGLALLFEADDVVAVRGLDHLARLVQRQPAERVVDLADGVTAGRGLPEPTGRLVRAIALGPGDLGEVL